MQEEVLGFFKGVDSDFFIKIEKGQPMLKVQNGVKIGQLHFEDMRSVDALIEQLEVLKRFFISYKGLSIINEKRVIGRLS